MGWDLQVKQAHLPELLARKKFGPAEGTRDGIRQLIVRRVRTNSSSGSNAPLLGHTVVRLRRPSDLIDNCSHRGEVCASDRPPTWGLQVADRRGPSQDDGTVTGREGRAGLAWFFLTVAVINTTRIGAGREAVDAAVVGGRAALLVRGKATVGVVGGHDTMFSDRLLMVGKEGVESLIKYAAARLVIFPRRATHVTATRTETHVPPVRLEGTGVLQARAAFTCSCQSGRPL